MRNSTLGKRLTLVTVPLLSLFILLGVRAIVQAGGPSAVEKDRDAWSSKWKAIPVATQLLRLHRRRGKTPTIYGRRNLLRKGLGSPLGTRGLFGDFGCRIQLACIADPRRLQCPERAPCFS